MLLGGHRGLGTTDNLHARSLAISQNKPAENTLESIRNALDIGADFIEIDVIKTKDDKLVVTHSNALNDHVFTEDKLGFLGDYKLADLQKLRVGPHGDGNIPLLSEVVSLMAEYRAVKKPDLFLNIEIKDVKGTEYHKFKYGEKRLLDLLADETRKIKDWVVFSSFAIVDLIEMEKLINDAKLALLFDFPEMKERFIYANPSEDDSKYMQFTPENIKEVTSKVKLSYFHPEIRSITEEIVKLSCDLGIKINSWALFEMPPTKDSAEVANFVKLSQKYNMKNGIITDFVKEMRKVVNGSI